MVREGVWRVLFAQKWLNVQKITHFLHNFLAVCEFCHTFAPSNNL